MKTRHDGDCHWYSARICDCGFLHQLSFEPETLSQEQANDVAEHQGNLRRFQDDQRASQSPASAPEQASVGADTVEAISALVHERWMEAKRKGGVTSRRSESGEELMVPYNQLSESAKELDRASVRAVLSAQGALSPRPSDVQEQQAEQGDGRLGEELAKLLDAPWSGGGLAYSIAEFVLMHRTELLAALAQPPRQSEDGRMREA
jgi:hypothetical protein